MEGLFLHDSCHAKRINVLISSQAEQKPHLSNKLHVKLEYLQRFPLRFNTKWNETNEYRTRNFRCGFSVKQVEDTNMCISKLRILWHWMGYVQIGGKSFPLMQNYHLFLFFFVHRHLRLLFVSTLILQQIVGIIS